MRDGGSINVHNILFAKCKQKGPLGRSRRRWEYNIKTDLKEIVCEGVHWIQLAQDRDQRWILVNTIMNLRIP
jgi:hypothetical protein